MARLLICVALLVFVTRVYGANTTTSTGPTPTPTTKVPAFTVLPTSAPNATYTIYNSSGSLCILMTGGIQMLVGYNLTNGNSRLEPVAVLNTTNATMVHGECGPTLANITLKGFNLPDNSTLYNITFIMKADESKELWNVSNVTVWMNLANSAIFKNNTEAKPHPKNNLTADNPQPNPFSSSLDYTRSYSCKTPMAYNMTLNNGAGDTYNLTLNLADFHLQAFQFQPVNTTQFGHTLQCPADIQGSKIVPIAVGAALAGLVIIVIVAYIVGRLRSRKQNSYEALS